MELLMAVAFIAYVATLNIRLWALDNFVSALHNYVEATNNLLNCKIKEYDEILRSYVEEEE